MVEPAQVIRVATPPTLATTPLVLDPSNDSLFLASSDNPSLTLTNMPFNGVNCLEWSMQIQMALGVKLRLSFINGL